MQQMQLQLRGLIAMRKVNASAGCLKTRSLQCTRPMHHQCHCTMRPPPPKNNQKQNKCIATQMPMQGTFQCNWTTQCKCKPNANARPMPLLHQTRVAQWGQCQCKINANAQRNQTCVARPVPMGDQCNANAHAAPPPLLPNPHSNSFSSPPNLTISALTLYDHKVTKYDHKV